MGKIFLGFLTGVILALIFSFYMDNSLATQVQAIATVITALTIAIGFYQLHQGKKALESNHDWNRRQLAITELRAIREMQILNSIQGLEDTLSYRERNKDNPYTIEEIHKSIGSFQNGVFSFSKNGKDVKKHIIELLNAYEYIAAGVNNSVFDEDIVKGLMHGGMIKTFNLFKPYILHYREVHSKNKKTWEQFESLHNTWSQKNQTEKRKDTA